VRTGAVLPVLIVALAMPGLARADDPMTKAKAEMAQLNYDAAIALLEKAEASGQNGAAEMVEIYRVTAEAHAAMGRGDAAETAFRRLLALDPSIELPAGSSPKLTGPFNAAREFLAGRRITIECRRGEAAASLIVQSDPVDLVAGGRLVTAGGGKVGDDARGQGRITLAVPGRASPSACAALDRQGNVLVQADLTDPPAAGGERETGAAASPVVTSAPAERGERPIYARWWLYAGLGAAAGGVAIYYGLKMKQAEQDIQDLNAATMVPGHDITYSDFLAIEDRGQRYARNANIALVATGVLAAVSGGLLVHQLMTERDPEAPAVTAAPLPGGAALNWTMGF
jgi:tetratricopeptide (TPR) repeat protein